MRALQGQAGLLSHQLVASRSHWPTAVAGQRHQVRPGRGATQAVNQATARVGDLLHQAVLAELIAVGLELGVARILGQLGGHFLTGFLTENVDRWSLFAGRPIGFERLAQSISKGRVLGQLRRDVGADLAFQLVQLRRGDIDGCLTGSRTSGQPLPHQGLPLACKGRFEAFWGHRDQLDELLAQLLGVEDFGIGPRLSPRSVLALVELTRLRLLPLGLLGACLGGQTQVVGILQMLRVALLVAERYLVIALLDGGSVRSARRAGERGLPDVLGTLYQRLLIANRRIDGTSTCSHEVRSFIPSVWSIPACAGGVNAEFVSKPLTDSQCDKC